MSGLALSTGFAMRGGSYTPMTPASATSASASGGTIGQAAYGVNGTGVPPRTVAAYGSVSIGVAAVAALVYLWWSLPH